MRVLDSALRRTANYMAERCRLTDLHNVADLPDRMDELGETFAFYLAAQPTDMRLNNARARIELKIPDLLEQHLASHNLPRIAHQAFQELEFLGANLNWLAIPGNRATNKVHLEIGDFQLGSVGRILVPRHSKHGVQTCYQLAKSKGLGEIV